MRAPDEYPTASIINHTRSWKSVFSYDFENSKLVIYKESRALPSSSLIIEWPVATSLYYYTIDTIVRFSIEKNPIFSILKFLIVDHRVIS